MDVQAYLNKKCRERWHAEQALKREKEEKALRKQKAYQEPEKDLTNAYLIKVGAKDVDLKDPRQFINKDIFDKLTVAEQDIYEAAHAKTHFVTIGRIRVDLKDASSVITRIQYDQLSREDKQIYLVAHPRNPEKATTPMKVTEELKQYLDHKYSDAGKCGIEKLNKSSFKWT